MAQQKKEFAAKSDNLSSIPRNHTVGENKPQKLSSDLHMCTQPHRYVYVRAHVYMHGGHTQEI